MLPSPPGTPPMRSLPPPNNENYPQDCLTSFLVRSQGLINTLYENMCNPELDKELRRTCLSLLMRLPTADAAKNYRDLSNSPTEECSYYIIAGASDSALLSDFLLTIRRYSQFLRTALNLSTF
jgi:hypothetical protein